MSTVRDAPLLRYGEGFDDSFTQPKQSRLTAMVADARQSSYVISQLNEMTADLSAI
jgi:hypothetical protein